MRPVLENGETRLFALNEWELLPTRAGVALSLQTVRTKSAKMTIDALSGTGELCVLSENPDELVNQFDNPDYAELKAELMAMIKSRPEDRREIQKQVGMA